MLDVFALALVHPSDQARQGKVLAFHGRSDFLANRSRALWLS